MKIVVIDGQGGGLGKNIVERLKAAVPGAEIIAVGTNAAATSNMLKGGADVGATGENPVLYNCRHADVIIGPMGIILPNAMYGEITPAMAAAAASSPAELVLIPMSKCQAQHVHIMGLGDKLLSRCLDEAAETVLNLCHTNCALNSHS